MGSSTSLRPQIDEETFCFEDLLVETSARVNLQTCYSPGCYEAHDAVDQHVLSLPQSGGSGPRREGSRHVFATCNWVAVLKAPAEEGGVALRPPPAPPRVAGVLAGGRTPIICVWFPLPGPPPRPPPQGLPAQRQLRVQLQQPV